MPATLRSKRCWVLPRLSALADGSAQAPLHSHPLAKRKALVEGDLLREGFRDAPEDGNGSLLFLGGYFISLSFYFLRVKNENNLCSVAFRVLERFKSRDICSF